jgi:hypothetical protein
LCAQIGAVQGGWVNGQVKKKSACCFHENKLLLSSILDTALAYLLVLFFIFIFRRAFFVLGELSFGAIVHNTNDQF